jgi:uncharacterized protein
VQFGGRYVLTAPRMRVWEALNDTAVLKSCIPGCERIQWVSENALEAAINVDFGPVELRFEGELALSDMIVAERYTLTGRGKGGWLGWARGSADIVLADHPEGTELAFAAQGEVASSIAKLGAALLGRSAQGVIDRFFERFAKAIGATSRNLADPPA